ncbi:MAG: LemA family protein [Saprospiraceae bacterium]|nr:LemA family protein [Saprospiraceae bacterium]MDW8229735.1 LemA family protein [Saprospiraceae bacterium]
MATFRKWLPLVFIGLVLILGFNMCNTYNSLVQKDEQVKKAWSQVENQYQRRLDLIPNLVETVKGYADFEKSTLQAVVEARANATRVTIQADELTPENLQRYEQAQGALSSALGRLLAVAENYPNLKANENFLSLQTQLEGTENRIAVERKNFNEVVGQYNSHVRRFPTNLYAGMLGFSQKAYFQSTPGAERAPQVKF